MGRIKSIKMLKNVSLRYMLKNFDRVMLMVFFDFEPWAIGKGDNRDYIVGIRKYLNNLPNINKMSVLELGSGLGDIIRYINCGEKMVTDRHVGLLRANKLLSFFKNIGSKPNYKSFFFGKDELFGKYDIVIMTNFCQGIHFDIVRNHINKFFETNLKKKGRIIIDVYEKGMYVHNIGLLFQEQSCRIKKFGNFQDRTLFEIIAND
jgi:hypothetical protein